MHAILLSLLIGNAVFTFDDGPNLRYTPLILDVLKKHNVKAVFCWPGKNLNSKNKLKIAKRALKEGHTLCNHSYNHPNFRKLSPVAQRWQIDKTQSIYKAKLNYKPKFFRAPGGAETKTMLSTVKWYKMYMLRWNIDSRDWCNKKWCGRLTTAQMYKKIVRKLKNKKNNIILFHDSGYKAYKILEKLILHIKCTK